MRESVSQSSLSPRGCPAPRQYVAQRSSKQAHQTFPYASQRALPQGGCGHLLPSDPAPWAPCRRLAQTREATEPWMLCPMPRQSSEGVPTQTPAKGSTTYGGLSQTPKNTFCWLRSSCSSAQTTLTEPLAAPGLCRVLGSMMNRKTCVQHARHWPRCWDTMAKRPLPTPAHWAQGEHGQRLYYVT